MKYIIVNSVEIRERLRKPNIAICREVVLNTSHIVSFEELDGFIAEFHDGKSKINTTQGFICAKESVQEVLTKIKECNVIY